MCVCVYVRVFMEIMLLNETTYLNRVDKQYVLFSFVFKALIKILVIYRNHVTFMLNMVQPSMMKHENNNNKPQTF